MKVTWASGSWDQKPKEVEINSLGDLTDFIEEEGTIILSYDDEDGLTAIVYDDYVE